MFLKQILKPPLVSSNMLPAVQFHDRCASRWEEHYQKRAFRLREAAFASCLPVLDLSGTRWLDAGCGTGRLARFLAGRGGLVLGVDASPTMISIARELAEQAKVSPPISFECVSTIETLPYQDGTFDGVLCSSVLEYLSDPDAALAELARVLKPGGLLLVSVPNRFSLLRRLVMVGYHLSKMVWRKPVFGYIQFSRHAYSQKKFIQCLDAHGFRTDRILLFGGPFFTWLQRLGLGHSLILTCATKRT